ncbi:MAG: transcription antitermination factor NusB [Myxococcales bacterium]|nr:transcription antitermination factor NusB [Myxococcales bacterium]
MKAGRRRAREFAIQALYAADMSGVSGGLALSGLWASQLDELSEPLEQPVSPEEAEFAAELVRGVMDAREEIDAHIEGASEHWRLPRMPVVDRNILRLGTWELMQRPDIPTSVTINEAIELAKRLGGAESRAFVNGLLDRIAGELGRGGRRTRS